MMLLLRFLSGGVFGGGLSLAQTVDSGQSSITAGIIVFGVGIVVGLSCVAAMNYLVVQRQRHEYETWVAEGRPDRRSGERRDGERRNGV